MDREESREEEVKSVCVGGGGKGKVKSIQSLPSHHNYSTTSVQEQRT